MTTQDADPHEIARHKLIDALIPLEHIVEQSVGLFSEDDASRLRKIVKDLQALESNLWRTEKTAE